MKIEIQNQLIDALRNLAAGLNVEDYWTLGLALVRGSTRGLGESHPEIQTAGVIFAGKMLNDPYYAAATIQKQGMRRADEKRVRLELSALTDGQGILLRDQLLELRDRGPATVSRGMKSYGETLDSPSGPLPKLSMAQRKAVCEGILDLQRRGFSPGNAKRKVADQLKVSLSTVSRAWGQRKALLADQTPLTVGQVDSSD